MMPTKEMLTEEQCAHLKRNLLPRILPLGWMRESESIDGMRYIYIGLIGVASTIIMSFELHNGHEWIHLSFSHVDRIPTWGELRAIKEHFIGDRYAYQVFPPRDKYINIHEYCLHLYAPLDPPCELPDFTQGGDTI